MAEVKGSGAGSGRRCHAVKNALRCVCQRLQSWRRHMAFDYFTTSLTISPLKNAALLNEAGEAAAAEYCHGATAFLNSDFKKKNGYKRSVELSELYGLYRQDYCGCVYSKAAAGTGKRAKAQEEAEHAVK